MHAVEQDLRPHINATACYGPSRAPLAALRAARPPPRAIPPLSRYLRSLRLGVGGFRAGAPELPGAQGNIKKPVISLLSR